VHRYVIVVAATAMLVLAVDPMTSGGSTAKGRTVGARVAKLERDVARLRQRIDKLSAAHLKVDESKTQVQVGPGERKVVFLGCNPNAVVVGGGFASGPGVVLEASGRSGLLPGSPPPLKAHWAVVATNESNVQSYLSAEAICLTN
jgi:hypothetical protein